MADLVARASFSAVSFVGTTAQTAWQILSPTNQRVKIKEVAVSFNGAVNTNVPVLCQLMIQTTAGTKSSGTLVATDGDIQETIQSVISITYTVEPSYSTIHGQWYIHPQTGIVYILPLAKPIVLAGAKRIGLVITAPNTVSGAGHVEIEE